MIGFLLLTAFILALGIGLSFIIAYPIKYLKWKIQNKKILYSSVSTFLFFPAIVPVTIVGIPVPNFFFLAIGNILYPVDTFKLYFKLWFFIVPSIVISFIIFLGIANMIFFKNPHLLQKTDNNNADQ